MLPPFIPLKIRLIGWLCCSIIRVVVLVKQCHKRIIFFTCEWKIHSLSWPKLPQCLFTNVKYWSAAFRLKHHLRSVYTALGTCFILHALKPECVVLFYFLIACRAKMRANVLAQPQSSVFLLWMERSKSEPETLGFLHFRPKIGKKNWEHLSFTCANKSCFRKMYLSRSVSNSDGPNYLFSSCLSWHQELVKPVILPLITVEHFWSPLAEKLPHELKRNAKFQAR